MIMSTINTIEGMNIIKTLGGVDAKSTMFASSAADSARNNLEEKAEQLGGNAIIGYRVDVEPMTGRAHAYGTVVVVKRREDTEPDMPLSSPLPALQPRKPTLQRQ